jgi:uncharacterized protein (DUF885 family)
MKKLGIVLFLIILFGSCKDKLNDSGENLEGKPLVSNAQLSEIFKEYHQGVLKINPMSATRAGDTRYNDRFVNVLNDSVKEGIKLFYTAYLEKVSQFADEDLNESDLLSKGILEWECTQNIKRLSLPDYTPIDQMWSVNLVMGQFASGASAQPFKTVQDYENWLKRVDEYLVWFASARYKMEEGIKNGYVLPKSLIVKVIPQMEAMAKEDLENHLYYTPVKLLPESFTEEEKTKLKNDYRSMVLEKIVPAHRDMVKFLKNVYLPAGRETSGFGSLPEGDRIYQTMITYFTTTDMTAEEIHELGLKEVARISSEMEQIMKEVGYKGDLKSFFEFVRNKKELMPFTDPQQVIDNFNAIHLKMEPQLNKLFELKPKTGFEVRRTEAFREKSASAQYNAAPLDGSRPGIFYVPIPNVREYNTYGDEDLFLHEAIPGHHYQISLQQENQELPDFRKVLWYSSFGEGWALYSESLGKELGLYTDPYQYFGMLGGEMHRAIRLVVDTGLHSKGWTREQAIQYSLDNEAETESSIVSEIERYMIMPGQALSYKIGEIKIRQLREKAENELGKNFDIRKFHTEVLEAGCLPLSLLETKIDQWIAENK